MRRKKIIIVLSILLIPITLSASAVFLVYKNQKELTQKAIFSLNEQFVGELTIEDSHISPFANFPYISIDLKGIRFYESKERDSTPIYEAAHFYVGFDIWDILIGKYKVKKLKLSEGHLDIVRFENGETNLLKAKGISVSDSSESSGAMLFDLSGIEIEKFDISYSDHKNQTELVFHLGKTLLDFKLKHDHVFVDLIADLVFDLDQNGENTFFADKKIHLDIELDYFEKEEKLIIAPSGIRLEEALFGLVGEVDFVHGMDLDLKVTGEKPDFNIFAAFLPKETADVLRRYKNEGQVYFIGSVRGQAGDGKMPAIAVEFGCDNAYFLNPGIDKKVEDLRFSGFYTNGKERSLKTSEIQLENFYARPAEGKFQGKLTVRNFEDPFIKVNLNADLDLEFLGQFFEIEGLQGLSGQVVLNMDFDELIDLDMSSASLANIKKSFQSELFLKNLSFAVPGYHQVVRNTNAYAYMLDAELRLDSLRFEIGDSDFYVRGNIDNFPAIFHGQPKPVKVDLFAESKLIDLSQLVLKDSLGEGLEESISDFEIKLAFETLASELMGFEYLPKGEFFVDGFNAKLKNYPHSFHDFHADVFITEDELILKDFKGLIDTTDFLFTGKVVNYPKWFRKVKNGDSSFEFSLVSDYLVIADLLSYKGGNYLPEDYRNEVFSNLKLEGILDLHYRNKFHSADFTLRHLEGKMKMHPLKLEDFKGRLHYEDNYIFVEDFSGVLGLSDFAIQMGYSIGNSVSEKKKRDYFKLTSNALDLDALMNFEGIEADTNHQEAFNIFDIPFREMDFEAKVNSINYHTFWLEDFHAKARSTENHFLYLDTLGLRAADGTLGIHGYFNGSDPGNIYFHSTMEADRLDIDKLLIKFENFGQDYLINENLHGKVSGTITSKFLVYPDFTPILEKSEANMNLAVYNGSLVNFTPLQAMAGYFSDRNLNNVRFDTLQNTFVLKEGVLNIPRMNINSSLGFIELSGKQGLDLNMDYFVRVPLGLVTQVGFRSLFGGRNKNEIDPDQEDAIVFRNEDKRVRFVNINMKGTPEDYKITLGRDRN